MRPVKTEEEDPQDCLYLPGVYRITPTQLLLVYGTSTGIGMILGLNLIYWMIYKLEHPFVEQFKIDKDRPWPWKEDYESWRQLCLKALLMCVFNNTVINAAVLVTVCYAYNWQVPWPTDVESIPDSVQLAKHFFFLVCAEDLAFHMSHRLLHCQWKKFNLYQMVHKYHHEFKQPISIASEYAHPIEFAIGNHQVSMVGLYLLGNRVHMWTLILWAFIRILETHEGHSGYEFPWSPFRLIPFGTDATYHNFHHTKNVGNYSSFMTVWDTIFDSNKEYYQAMSLENRDGQSDCAKL